MSDLYREPIEDSDLALKEKFVGGKITASVQGAQDRGKEKSIEGAAERDGAYGRILQKVQASDDDKDADKHLHTVAADARAGARHLDEKAQIKHLVDTAMQKGVVHAVRVARRMEDYHILDTFHDKMLAEELHNALEKKGLI
ncbi:MAG TPA: hypothetical protein ENJ77_01485 [Candidatus Moranbacteria bacterium]|nr:hypothetical protein [Candidatus Moranbacteria bacterium]